MIKIMSDVKEWSCNNKLVVFFILTTLCLFVSTVALSVQKQEKCGNKLNANGPSTQFGVQNAVNDRITDQNYYRLSRDVVPKNYALFLTPYMSNNTFHGVVTITIKVLEPTQTISLHSNNLTIHEVNLKHINGRSVLISSTNTTKDRRELLNVNLEQEIKREYYKLNIKFSGALGNKIVGFYASNLKNGGTHLLRWPLSAYYDLS